MPTPSMEVLLLGTFHFEDAGLDEYKPEHALDILGDRRQKELERLLSRLEGWAPTKVAVEVRADRQDQLDASYSAWRAGRKELTGNEIHQVGFRLAQRLEHGRVWAVDAPQRGFEPWPDASDWAMRNGQAKLLVRGGWDGHFRRLYEYDDAAKLQATLIEHLLYQNSEERLRRGAGHYLVGSMAVGDGTEYPGADARTAWYNRNLRIFSNLLRLGEDGDRILVVIGAGHVPILRHAVDVSPDFRLVEVADVIGQGKPPDPAEADRR